MDWKNVFLVVAAVVIGAVVLLYAFPSGEGTEETVTTNITLNFFDSPGVSVHKGNITTWTMVDGEWTFTTEPDQGDNTTWIFHNITSSSNCYDQLAKAVEIAGATMVARDDPFGKYIKAIDGVISPEPGESASGGWQYYVNGFYANKACNLYALEDGDNVVWKYQLSQTS